MLRYSIALLIALLLTGGPAMSADPPRGAPPEATSDVGNWGSTPYVGGDYAILRPEDRAAMRKLEDKHIAELRQLQDKQDTELHGLRVKQAKERDDLRKTFGR